MEATSYADESGSEWETRKISVVGALQSFITQLTIGDDLTKISLPSTLLFPYSSLELAGSRTLGYYHYVLAASKQPDPVSRMLGLVKWYLTYTQQEKLGKKPFNPILAETHMAWVDLSDPSYKEEGGPFKGYTKFFAEQTSHHPPVCAFTIENQEEKVRSQSTLKFSTAFHGNSVTAYTMGPTHIDFLDHGERYTITKTTPDICIRNVILGTRRHSWEGDTEIICEKTGLRVTFHYFEEGWWCVNTVNGTLSKLEEPDQKLYTFYGPLGQVINITDVKTNKTQQLIDLAKTKKNKIHYLPYERMNHTSSLKLWKDLSKAIVADDMHAADVAKHNVETAQRKRRADGTSYSASYFKEDPETNFWSFDTSKWAEIDQLIQDTVEGKPIPKPVEHKEEVKHEEHKEEKKEDEIPIEKVSLDD